MSDDQRTDEEEISPKPSEVSPTTNEEAATASETSEGSEATDAESAPGADDEHSAPAGDGETEAAQEQPSDAPRADRAQRREGFLSRHFFSLLALVLVAELVVYGRRGELNVCVAKERIHDFALLGQERTDANRWKFPTCEARTNLSMVSHYDDAVSEAKKGACRRATQILLRGQSPQCIKSADGWQFRVDTRQVWPWEKPFYRTMLHLD